MATLTHTYKEYPPEKDGSRYVDYKFTSDNNDIYEIKNIREPANVTNLNAKALTLYNLALKNLLLREHENNKKNMLRRGKKAININYIYGDKTTKLTELYLEELLNQKQNLQTEIDEIQPVIDDLQTFLGI
jgi:hypothetical protein